MIVGRHKLDKVFAPATSLMMRLNFAQKSTLLVVIIVLTFFVITNNLYSYLNRDIEIDKQELAGLDLLPPIFETIQLLQKHRGLSASVLGGTSTLSESRDSLLVLTQSSFSTLESNLPESIILAEQWLSIKKQWDEIASQGMSWSSRDNFATHSEVIQQLYLLILTISDRYLLTNHHDLAAYYLFNTAIQRLLPAQELLGQTRALGAGVLAAKTATEEQKMQIHALLVQVNDAMASLERDLSKTADYIPLLEQRLHQASTSILENSRRIDELVQSNILENNYTISAEQFFTITTKAIDDSYRTLNDDLIPTLKGLIKQRLSAEENTLKISLIVIVIMVLSLLYLAMGIYLSTVKNIQAISGVTTSFAEGDFSQRIHFRSNSELKYLARSFNLMADKLASLIRNEEKDKARIKAIMDSAQDALVQMDSSGKITGWSKQAEHIFGWSVDDVIGQKVEQVIIPSYLRDKHSQGLQQFLSTGKAKILNKRFETVALHSDGHEFPIELTISPIKTEQDYEFNTFIRDISERKQAEDNLQLFFRVFKESHEGIVITDPKGNISDVNPAFCTLSGYSREDVIGTLSQRYYSKEQTAEFYQKIGRTIKEQGHWQGEIWSQKKTGERFACALSISSLKDEDNQLVHYVGIFSDITQSKQQQEELALMAHYDMLTGLPNRSFFADRFLQAVAHSKRSGSLLAVCFLDLDGFKPINDNYGHDIGDKILIEVANRIQASIREEDTVSRQGGDEFAILLQNLDSRSQCKKTLERIHQTLAQPYFIDGHTHRVTASSGISLYPVDGNDIDTLLRFADKAMYQAKQSGRNQYYLFEET